MALRQQLLHGVVAAADDERLDAADLLAVHHVERRRDRVFRDELHLDHVVLQVGEAPFQQELSVVHDADMVAHVLQLAQVVRRDEHRRLMCGDVL